MSSLLSLLVSLSLLVWCIICTYDSCSVYGWIVPFPFSCQFPQQSLLPLSSSTRRTTMTTVTTTTMAIANTHTPLLSTAAAAAAAAMSGHEHEHDEPTDQSSITALPFPLDVFDFLNKNQISWNKVDTDNDIDTDTDNDENNDNRHMIIGVRTIPYHHHVIALHRRSNNTTVGRGVLLLHLIPTPTTVKEAMEPTFNKQWTDNLRFLRDNNDDNNDDADTVDSVIPDKVIHLHQDIWDAKPLIVQSRIMAQVGMTQRRIFARKTTVKRINATVALNFLHHHHLWDATRSKYYYGLFILPAATSVVEKKELVAVATFSSRRKVLRNKQVFRSHELIRFCSLRDSTVVGGISKLLKKFIQEQQPDDIITVVDRDWGDGSGWHHQSLGFETVAIMDPIVMAVNPHEKGVRRQLVGAGISPTTTTSNSSNDVVDSGRIGLPIETWNKLSTMNTAKDANYSQALEYLANDHYYPVYDSGVERLCKVVVNKVNKSQSSSHQSKKQSLQPQPHPQQSNQQQELLLSGKELWHHSTPNYADKYYSPNAGIASLLEFARSSAAASSLSLSSSVSVSRASFPPPTSPLLSPSAVDFEEDMDSRTMASWHATSGTATSARLVFSAPSSLDPKMTVEVRKRPNGWHTVGIVGIRESGSPTVTATVDDDNSSDGATKKKKNKKTTTTSIYHGVYKVEDTTHRIESNKVVSEYIKTMATLALSGLEAVAANTNGTTTSTTTTKRKPPYRFLHYGYGAGTLVRFLAQHCDPSSEHVVLELDSGVVAAANFIQTQQSSVLPTRNNNNVQLQLGDAVTYHQQYHNRTMQQQQEKQSTKDNNDDDDKMKQQLSSSSLSSVLFDCILIDVFDEENQVPKEMYSPQFLSGLSHNFLTPNGIIIHNFHSGGSRHTQVCQDAVAAYSTIFGSRRSRRGEEHNNKDDDDNDDGCCFWVDSLDSKSNAGNVIVLASKSSFLHRSNSPTTTSLGTKRSGNDDDSNRTHNNATQSNEEEENNTAMRIHDDKHEDDDVLTRCARTIQTKYNLPFDAAVRVSPERSKTEF